MVDIDVEIPFHWECSKCGNSFVSSVPICPTCVSQYTKYVCIGCEQFVCAEPNVLCGECYTMLHYGRDCYAAANIIKASLESKDK